MQERADNQSILSKYSFNPSPIEGTSKSTLIPVGKYLGSVFFHVIEFLEILVTVVLNESNIEETKVNIHKWPSNYLPFNGKGTKWRCKMNTQP